jgi:phosphoenolpyruvate-protein kinase (PTS system EI component)
MELVGIAASPGTATGPVFALAEPPAPPAVTLRGMDSVREAMAQAAAALEELADRVRDRSPQGAEVLEAQALLARDETIEPDIQKALDDGLDPVTAVREAFEEQAAQLEALTGDGYAGLRAADLRQVGRAVQAALTGEQMPRLFGLTEPAIVVAHDLSPEAILATTPELLLGVVTETGGDTSHAAIVARELGVPAVLGVDGALAAAAAAPSATIDGGSGIVRFSSATAATPAGEADAGDVPIDAWLPLLANAGSVQAAVSAARRGAQGVGLLRTELLYLGRSSAPTEEEQLSALRQVCAVMPHYPVIVRTFDGGSDKALPYLAPRPEPNPALGARGVRLWLAHPDLAAAQARALLRAGAEHRNLLAMLPMVAARAEVEAARALFEREAGALGLPPLPLGIMVETPAAAASLPAFQGVIDFVSLGTNDLAQYASAADRELNWGDDLREWNPGTLRLIQRALADARSLGVDAGVCGELAGAPAGAILLAGLGATSLSMSAASLPAVSRALRTVGPDRCAQAAEAALAERTASEARTAVQRRLSDVA